VGVCAPNVGSKIGADVVFDDLTPFPGWLEEFATVGETRWETLAAAP
jgi:hypothetical protein